MDFLSYFSIWGYGKNIFIFNGSNGLREFKKILISGIMFNILADANISYGYETFRSGINKLKGSSVRIRTATYLCILMSIQTIERLRRVPWNV